MPRETAKKAGAAAIETTLRAAMPALESVLSSIQRDIRAIHDELRRVDAKIDNLREEMLDRFERQLALINETNDRVTKLEGKPEGYMEALRLFVAPTAPPRATSRKRVG